MARCMAYPPTVQRPPPRARLPWLFLVTCLLCLTSARSAAAQETATVAISLPAALQVTERAAPDVLVAVARASSARAEVAVAGMFPNPRLTVGAASGSAVVYGNLFIALPLFGQRRTAMEAADAQARVVAAGVDVARLDARLAVTLAWIDLWLMTGQAQIARDNAARRDRLLETARVRFDEGGAPRLEVLRLDTDARRARAEVAALDGQQAAAAARLAVLLGQPAAQFLEAQGEPRSVAAPPALASLEALVVDHPVARRAQALLGVADAVIARERRARWPLIGVQVGANLFERQPPPANDFSVALSMDLPFFSAPLVARAEANRGAARVELDALLAQLRSALVSARSEYLATELRYAAQVEEVLPAAREAADLAAEAYRSGGLDLTGTLAAEQVLSDTRLAVVRATADRGRALGLFEHVAGRML